MSRRSTRIAIALTAISLFAAACGGGEAAAGSASNLETRETSTTVADPGATTTRIQLPPSDYAGFAAQPVACDAVAPAPVQEMTFAEPEDQGLDPDNVVQATITTSCGDIVVELDPGIAPDTVNSFVFLARSGYFDGSVSHRIMPRFVMQAGDPTATGMGGPGYVIPDELPEAGFVYETGSLAMANSGPNTGGSQFFIALADVPLPNAYSYFGKVVDGFDTLEAIAEIPLGVNRFGEQSVPLETLYIDRVIVQE